MKRCHLDANVVLRFLRNDDPKQAPKAKRLVESAAAGQIVLVLSAVTVAEVFYAFRASYRMPRPDVAKLLSSFLSSTAFVVEHESRVLEALRWVAERNVDFGDAYLAATALEANEPVASFDTDFSRFPSVQLLEL